MKRAAHPSSTGRGLSIAGIEPLRGYRMSRYEDACPIEASARASRCQSCCSTAGVPPCVAAYLGGRAAVAASNVVPLFRVEVMSSRKAA